MYFKIEKGTNTHVEHSRVWREIIKCNRKAVKIVEEMGFDKYCKDSSSAGGGIEAVKADEKPNGYKSVCKPYQNLYYPKVSNKELIRKIDSLPTVSFDEFNKTIGFEDQFQGMNHYRSFGSKKVGDIYIISIYDECDYDPKPDMIEILASEHKELNGSVD